MLRIVTDGAADMPESWEKQYGINILPLRLLFGDKELLQGRDINSKNFYKIVLEKRIFPKTSLPSVEEIQSFYKSIAQKGDSILSIHVGSKLSGTFSVAQMAARELEGEFDIYPFDSGAGSAVQGIMCREARLMSQSGIHISRILERLNELRMKMKVVFTVENLEFARLSGRISSFQTAISSLLKINPIIDLKDGLLRVGQKVRTRQRAFNVVVEEIREKLGGQPARLAVVHADAPTAADQLIQLIKANIPAIIEITLSELSIAVAAHLGPGAIGIVAIPMGEDLE